MTCEVLSSSVENSLQCMHTTSQESTKSVILKCKQCIKISPWGTSEGTSSKALRGLPDECTINWAIHVVQEQFLWLIINPYPCITNIC